MNIQTPASPRSEIALVEGRPPFNEVPSLELHTFVLSDGEESVSTIAIKEWSAELSTVTRFPMKYERVTYEQALEKAREYAASLGLSRIYTMHWDN